MEVDVLADSSPTALRGYEMKGRFTQALEVITLVVLTVAELAVVRGEWRDSATAGRVQAIRPDAPLPTQPVHPRQDGPRLGTGPVAALLFSEFQCPFCDVFRRDVMPVLEREYIDQNTLTLYFAHFPLESIHPYAVLAAEVAECASLRGDFWPIHGRLFDLQRSLTDSAIRSLATDVGLAGPTLDACRSTAAERVRADVELGKSLGVRATPSLLLGIARPDGTIDLRQRLSGARPVEEYRRAIEALAPSTVRQ